MVPLSSETLKCSYSPEPFLTFVLQIPLANTQHDTSPSSEVPKEQEEHFLLSQQSPAAASRSDSDAATVVDAYEDKHDRNKRPSTPPAAQVRS